MAKSVLQTFYAHNAEPLKPKGEMQSVTTEPKVGCCTYCGCGNFTLRMVKLWTIRTRQEESYIVRKCKFEECGKDQIPLI